MCTPQCIIEKVGSLVFDEAVKAAIKAGKYVKDYTTNLKELDDEIRKLEGRREIIQRIVCEAKDDGKLVYTAVSDWLKDADTMTRDVRVQQLVGQTEADRMTPDVEEQLVGQTEADGVTRDVQEQLGGQTEADGVTRDVQERLAGQSSDTGNMSCFKWSCPNIKRRYQLSKEAKEKIADVKKLIEESHFNENEISYPRPPPSELEFPSNENYVDLDSRTPVFERIVDALKHPSVNVIGVHGLGGVGKTMLVEEVGKKMRLDGNFKQVTIAVVPKDLNVKEIQSKLADILDFKLDAALDEKGRATQLWNKFTNGERFLVILDDIWKEVNINAIGIPLIKGSTTGCKVVLTSRNEGLLVNRMNVDKPFPIAELKEQEAWTLFKKKVGDSIESQPELYSLAYEVCKKCKGLPVALNALGAALKGKPNNAWKDALVKLERYMITNIEGIDPSVWASLKLSYDLLWSSNAKSCFLLCCLFHEDVEISIDDLTRHCVARSLLSPNPRILEEARNAVRTLVDDLKLVSLLSNGDDENVVRIHDVIRDVGISIAHEKEAFLVDHGALRWPRNPTNELSYKAMSLSFKSIKALPDGLVYPKLHTLMVANSELSDLEFPDNFFNGMMQLTVLTCTRMRMRQLPSSLAKLTNLRMLYLNDCELDDIAILKDLKSNLEVLSLRDSSIEALPLEIGQLTSLRVLDLQNCDELMVIPQGIISKLTSLEELYFPMTFDKWEATTDEQQDTSSEDNASLEELRESLANASLEELRESLANAQLTTLHIHVPNVNLLPKEDLKFADLKGFRISVGSEFDYYEANSRTCMLKLEGIQLRNEFIPLVEKAEELVLTPESSVHPLRLFNKLTVLIIEHFKLKYLFSPTFARGLVHLEVLKVTSCEIMEGIVGFEEQEDESEITGEVKFSKLKRLELRSLPNLISFFAKKEKMGTTMGSFSARAQPLFNELVIFPVLERLTIDGLGSIIKIWDKQSVAVLEEQGSFSQLTDLVVKHCSKLMHVFPSNMHPLLKNLEELKVEKCETMKGIAEFEGEIDEDGLRNEVASPAREHLEMVGVIEIQDKQPLPEPRKEVESLCRPVNNDDIIVFPRLKYVNLIELPELKSFYSETQGFFSHKVVFPILKRIRFWNLDKITRIWDDQPFSEPEKEDKSFSELEDIIVDGCDQLEYVFPSYLLPQLKNLQELKIQSCTKVEVIISNNPKEKEATNNNDTIRFPQLKTLELEYLPNLKSFIRCETQLLFSNKVVFPVLERLFFVNLNKISRIWDNQPLSEPEIKEAKSFLQKIHVRNCNQLEYVLPFYMLPQLKNLQELNIWRCRKMEMIISNNPKEKEATNNNDIIRFPQLKEVSLRWLPNLISFICSDEMQLFFSNKDAFPVLEFLDLSNDFEFLRNETSTKEECGTSGKESDYNGEELVDEDLETPTKENNKMAGTSPAQARKGKDIQEIPWERLNITREKYRQTRLEQFENHKSIPQSGEVSEKDCNVTMKGGMYYEFKRNSRSVKSTILHDQLRNSVWATSKHDVYLMSHFSVTHWSALTCNKTEVLNVSGHVAPCEKHPGSLLEGFTQTEVSTLAVKDRLLVVGGFQGELICKNLDRPGVCFCMKTTYDDNAVTNAVEIYSTQSGAVHFTVANNDCGVRDFDMENFQLSKHFSFPWPVNHTSMSPDGKLRIIVGDNPEGMLVDSGTGKMVASLVGHMDFSFASAWHPDGLTFATGNQDKTCRIWDARNLSKSVAALKGNLGAIRSIHYSSDGRFMAMAEPADFVHVFDAKSGYEKEQEIDFFGEISGMSFSPDTESLFIGVCIPIHGSLLEFRRRRNNSCPDSII